MPAMGAFLSDTHPQAERMQIELLRQAPPWKRLDMYVQLYRAVRDLSYMGLRDRFPNDPPRRLQRRLADLLLGPELAEKAYGPLEE